MRPPKSRCPTEIVERNRRIGDVKFSYYVFAASIYSQTLNHNYQKIIGSIATIHWAWANHAITCIDYVISLTCYQFDQKKLIPIKYYNGDLLIKSTAIVMLPLSADTVNSFHPLRNKPAVWFTQDLPPTVRANCLLLGCGDPRNILFSIFSEDSGNSGIL